MPEKQENLHYMRLLDEQYLKTPFYGVLRMHAFLCSLGYCLDIKRVRRLLRKMGIEAIYPKPNLSKPDKNHMIYPYLLRNVDIVRNNQVWSSDITYIPMKNGFLYLVAIIDWYSRFVLSWELSNTLDKSFCINALERALNIYGKPEIFNTDQGSQFTSVDYINILKGEDIKISMDGKGRAIDNIFIERLWRSVKYEYVYINSPENGKELWHGLDDYLEFYNHRRFHQSLAYKTPNQIYRC